MDGSKKYGKVRKNALVTWSFSVWGREKLLDEYRALVKVI